MCISRSSWTKFPQIADVISVILNKGRGGLRRRGWSDGSSRTPKSVPSEFHVFAPAPAAAWSRAQKSWGKKESVAVARWRGRHGIKGSNLSCLLQFHRSLVQPLVQWPEVQAWYKGILCSCVQ